MCGTESMMLSVHAESIILILSAFHAESAIGGRVAAACLDFVCCVMWLCDVFNLSIFWDYIYFLLG